jgi:sigma-E factor negative regulatory protein RseB
MIDARRGATPAALLLSFAVLAAVAGGAGAETRSTALPGTPQGWLERMSRALRNRSFEGTFVYLHSGQIETMRIAHEAQADGGERERVLALNGPARQIIRDDQKIICILPDRRLVVVEKRRPHLPFPIVVPIDTARLRPYYAFRMFGHHRVAGRAAQAIAILPKDRYRYGYHLYMDEATGLPLESVVLNEHGRRVEQILFTSLKVVDHIPLRELEPESVAGKGFTFYRQEDDENPGVPGINHWVLGPLPAGFVQIMYTRRRLPGSRNPVQHLVLSDGLASVSVYIEKPVDGKEFLRGALHMGAVNAYGRMTDGYQVTVVGEVPEATVRAVSDALRYDSVEK